MKRTAITVGLALALMTAPALAKGGKQGLNVNLNVATGKNGLARC